MRIVQLVCSDGFGGVEQYVLGLTAGLVAAGVEVEVVGGAADRMQEPLRAAGAGWHRGDDPWQALRALRALRRPELIVSHMSQADLVAAVHRRTPRGRRVRQVSVRHFAAPRGSSRLARAGFRAVSRGIAAQLAISEYVAAQIDGESTVVHTGVARQDAVGRRERTVLVAQRLEREKDTETALRAWAASRAAESGWRLRIAGDGGERPVLTALVRALGVTDSVEFLGYRRDVPALLASAGLVLAPTPREGLGILVLEAMAAGAPVVAADGGGHRETVGAVRPDLLFAPGDYLAAAGTIDRLIADDRARAEAGRMLQDLQRERFGVEQQVAGALAVFRRALA